MAQQQQQQLQQHWQQQHNPPPHQAGVPVQPQYVYSSQQPPNTVVIVDESGAPNRSKTCDILAGLTTALLFFTIVLVLASLCVPWWQIQLDNDEYYSYCDDDDLYENYYVRFNWIGAEVEIDYCFGGFDSATLTWDGSRGDANTTELYTWDGFDGKLQGMRGIMILTAVMTAVSLLCAIIAAASSFLMSGIYILEKKSKWIRWKRLAFVCVVAVTVGVMVLSVAVWTIYSELPKAYIKDTRDDPDLDKCYLSLGECPSSFFEVRDSDVESIEVDFEGAPGWWCALFGWIFLLFALMLSSVNVVRSFSDNFL